VEDLLRIVVTLVVIGLIAWVIALVVERLVGRVTIREYQRGLRFEAGKFVGLLDAGSHVWFRPTSDVLVVDARPSSTAIEGQEVLTADGVAVKVSLVVRTVVGDPVARLTADQDSDRLLYLLVQLGLREVVAGRTLDDVLSARTTIGPAVAEIAAARMGEIGIELLSVDIRDVMVPAELRRAYAAVVTARHEGAATLERARGETAALRNLANAGRLLDDHPGLLSLRLVQELGAAGGNTLVLGLPDASAAARTGSGSATPEATRRGGRGPRPTLPDDPGPND
jgi:regulator of protease activity HflC (stomatin/prohibitin superfamily)